MSALPPIGRFGTLDRLLAPLPSGRTFDVALTVAVILLSAPLFVRFGGPTLIGLPETSSQRVGGFTVPVGALVSLAVSAWLFFARRRHRTPSQRIALDAPVLVFLGAGALAFAFGLATRFGIYNALNFGQVFAPLSAYYIGSRLVCSDQRVERVLRTVALSVIASAALMLAYNVSVRGLGMVFAAPLENRVGPLNIYQANDYVPFVFATAYLVTLYVLVARQRLTVTAMAALLVLGLVVLASYARGPLLVLVVGLGVLVAESWRRYLSSTLRAVGVTLLALMIATALDVPSVSRLALTVEQAVAESTGSVSVETSAAVAPSATIAPASPAPLAAAVQAAQTAAHSMSLSNVTRIISARAAADFLLRHPLFGAGFAPIPGDEFSPAIVGIPDWMLLPAHNQYLDLGLRGGLVLLTAFAGLLITTMSVAWRMSRSAPGTWASTMAGGLLVAVLPTLMVANMYQNNFTQPYSAFLLWFLIGSAAGMLTATTHSPERGKRA